MMGGIMGPRGERCRHRLALPSSSGQARLSHWLRACAESPLGTRIYRACALRGLGMERNTVDDGEIDAAQLELD